MTVDLDDYCAEIPCAGSRATLVFHRCRGLRISIDFLSKLVTNDCITRARARRVTLEDLGWLDTTIPLEVEGELEKLVLFEMEIAETADHEFALLAESFSLIR